MVKFEIFSQSVGNQFNRFYWAAPVLETHQIGGRLKRMTDGQREIGGDRFREIAKTASSGFLFLIQFMLKIFQFVMKITMN